MPLRVLLLPALLCLLSLSRGLAADLDYRIFRAPATMFTSLEMSTLPEGDRADFADILRKRGLDLPDGSAALYDAATASLFLRSTTRDIAHFQRFLDEMALPEVDEDSQNIREVELTAICYAIPLAAVPPDFTPQSRLASLPADKLTVIDRVALICRAGQIAKTESAQEDPKAPPPPDAEHEEAPNHRSLEMEATIGDGNNAMDINLAWDIHTPLLAPPGELAAFRISCQILTRDGDRVIQELGVTAEAEPRLVLLVLEPALRQPARTSATSKEDPAK